MEFFRWRKKQEKKNSRREAGELFFFSALADCCLFLRHFYFLLLMANWGCSAWSLLFSDGLNGIRCRQGKGKCLNKCLCL